MKTNCKTKFEIKLFITYFESKKISNFLTFKKISLFIIIHSYRIIGHCDLYTLW